MMHLTQISYCTVLPFIIMQDFPLVAQSPYTKVLMCSSHKVNIYTGCQVHLFTCCIFKTGEWISVKFGIRSLY